MYSTFSEPLETISSLMGFPMPLEDVLNARYATVERIKFDLDTKYRLHPNNYVKRSMSGDRLVEQNYIGKIKLEVDDE